METSTTITNIYFFIFILLLISFVDSPYGLGYRVCNTSQTLNLGIADRANLGLSFSFAAPELVNRHGANDDEADNDLLHEVIRACHGEAHSEYSDDKGSDHRSSHRAHASHQARAANDGGGNCVQLVAICAVGLGGDHP